ITAAVRRAHNPDGDGLFEVEHRLLHPEGERWVSTRAQTLFEGHGSARRPARTVGASLDITERKLAERQIAASLREKDTLLREIHHRVKNNLQIISSLLHFQAKKLADAGPREVFQEGRDRLQSMILVHDKLYRSQDLSAIDFGDYVRSLTQELARSNQSRSRNIDLKVEGENLALPIEAALPCGMILSELLTNVFKYAYPDGRPGDARVQFETVNGQVIVSVKDHGVGMSQYGAALVQGFGMQLVHNLAEQLGGSIRVESGCGTTVTLQFPERSFVHAN
ncbi:MAG TPA: histidine kinase dimerization/phosphoacceptor domain -containing protein, partial [Alphaproteobacteria bacterium]|nr:histidine kinase dimerization/phosphoacceptor domain -containing protein [Alphaproteobacteria bacterium]